MQLAQSALLRLIRAGTFLLAGLLLAFLVVLFGSRLQVNEELRLAIQAGALDNAGLCIEIGSLRGYWWSGLTLQDVKVHAGPTRDTPLLGTVPVVAVEYSLLGLLGPRQLPLRIDAYQPSLGLVINANRLFNLQPRARAPHEEKPPEPPPPVDMVFHGGHVSYRDLSVRKPFQVDASNVTGTGSIRGFDLTLDLQGLREQDRLQAHVDYDLKQQRGKVTAHARDVALPYWINRFAYAPEFTVKGGHADVDAVFSWQDPMLLEEARLTGSAHVTDGEVALLNVAKPLVGVHGDVRFDERVAHLDRLEGTLEGMPVVATGKVTGLLDPKAWRGGPDQGYDVDLATPHVELDKLDRLWPGLKSLQLAGLGSIKAHVSGTASAPHVVMRGLVPAGRYGKEPLTHVVIDADYVTGRFDLPHFAMDLAQGHADGKAFVGIPERGPVPYTVDARFAGIEVAEWIKRYRDEPWPFAVSGRLHGELHTRGEGAHQRTTAELGVLAGRVNHEPVQEASASCSYETPNWRVPRWRLRWGPTAVAGTASGRDADEHGRNAAFNVGFQVASGELRQWVHLNPHPPHVRITGAASGSGQLAGDPSNPHTWTGNATLLVSSGIFDRQPYRDADALMSLANNQLTITRARIHAVNGLVRATGLYRPFILKGNESPTSDLDVAASGMSLGAMANLPRSCKGAKGPMDGRFAVHIHDRDVQVAGRMRIQRPRLPGWVHLDQAIADFTWTPTVATLRPLILVQGADQYEVRGRIGQVDDTYPLDLHVRLARADVKTLLGAVPWPDVMARLQPQRTRSHTAGTLREVGTLPASGSRQQPAAPPMLPGKRRGAGGLDLAAALDRWASLRKTPLHRPPAEAPLLPFWEESSGKLWLDAHVTGPILTPAVRVAASARQLRVFDRLIDDAALVMGVDQAHLDLPRFRLREGGKVVLSAQGALTPRPGDSLTVRARGLDLDWSRPALASRQLRLEGRGDMLLRLAGPFESPRAWAKLDLSGGRFTGPAMEPIAFEAVDANLSYDHGRLAIPRAIVRQDGKLASFSGALPVTDLGPHAPVELAMRLEDGNLGILNLLGQRRFQWQGGKGTIDLHLGGTMGQPKLAGQVHLHDGSFRAEGLPATVSRFAADVTLDDRRVEIHRMRGTMGGGEVEIAGNVLWDQFEPQSVDLTARARPFQLDTPGDLYHGKVSADVHLQGPVSEPTLGGEVGLWDGKFDLRNLGSSSAATEPSAVPPLRLAGLVVDLGPSLHVKNSLVDVDVTTKRKQGHLAIDGTLAAPQPSGTVVMESGTIRPLNNPFKIVEGRVDFVGERLGSAQAFLGSPNPINAHLDVHARSTVYDYSQNENLNVLAHVTGTLDQMDMRFTSEPLRSDQEILDILSKKQVLEGALGGRYDRGEVIVKEVGGFVSSSVEDLVSPYTLVLRDALNLQTFRFELVADPDKASLSDLAGYRPALTLETRPLWDRLSLSSRLVVGEVYTASPTLYGENTYVSATYRLTRWLGLEYRIDPYIDPENDRVLGHTLGLRTQITF